MSARDYLVRICDDCAEAGGECCNHPECVFCLTRPPGLSLPTVAVLRGEVAKLRGALQFYANEENWVNRSEFKNFPGFHGAATAQRALGGEGTP